eukprot:scaffold36473_cov72-Phaeocystis_antarctica.AAC.3
MPSGLREQRHLRGPLGRSLIRAARGMGGALLRVRHRRHLAHLAAHAPVHRRVLEPRHDFVEVRQERGSVGRRAGGRCERHHSELLELGAALIQAALVGQLCRLRHRLCGRHAQALLLELDVDRLIDGRRRRPVDGEPRLGCHEARRGHRVIA